MAPYAYTKNEEALRLNNDATLNISQEYRGYFRDIARKTHPRREVIATIDISQGKPTLVKSSVLTEHHSGDDLETAYSYISVIPKVVLVDLDSAIGKGGNNREAIKRLKRRGNSNVYGVGGGIRSFEVLNYYLN